MGRNGSMKALPHRLALQDHQVLGWQLRQVQEALAAIADTVSTAYGKSAEVTRYTAKLADSCNTLRGQLARQLDSEYPLVDAEARQACYASPTHDQPSEDQEG